MDLDFNGDVTCLDAELLQLSEVSPLAIKANPYVAEKLFDQWLSLPETNALVIFFSAPFFVSFCVNDALLAMWSVCLIRWVINIWDMSKLLVWMRKTLSHVIGGCGNKEIKFWTLGRCQLLLKSILNQVVTLYIGVCDLHEALETWCDDNCCCLLTHTFLW